MSVKLYTGIQGSGKTYEVVSEVILNCLRRGRRVISNIAGLNFEAMRELLMAEGVEEKNIGQLVCVTNEQIMQPLFWKADSDKKAGIKSFIQLGDVLCLDEIWRFWDGFNKKDEDGNKRPERVLNFFRTHRHMPNPETGLTCEIALITQLVTDLSRQFRGAVDEIYAMSKLTAIGSTTRYRVDIYPRKITRTPLRSIQRSYNPKYFGLYASHSQKEDGAVDAVEQTIDARGNIFHGAMFKIALPVGFLVLIPSIYFMYKFFHPAPAVVKDAPVVAAAAGTSPVPAIAKPVESDSWRVVGHYLNHGFYTFIIQNPAGNVRQLIDPPKYKLAGFSSSVELPEGGFATSWATFESKKGGLLP